MKTKDLTDQQREELEKFGANTWFVEYLHKQYEENPSAIPEQWKKFFDKSLGKESDNGHDVQFASTENLPKPEPEDEVKIIAGSSAKVLENMSASLTIPVATSQRTIPPC